MKKILIIVDMQNDFIDGALGSKEAVKIVNACEKKILDFSGDIFVTLDTHTDDYLNTREGKYLPIPHCIKGTDGHRLNPKIEKALSGKNYTIVEKPAFGSVELPNLILEKTRDEDFEIELFGLCTDICVVSNAIILKASFPETDISVFASCCAGVTPEKHNSALETMRSCQINIKEA